MKYTDKVKSQFGSKMTTALIEAGYSRPGRGQHKGTVVADYRWFAQAYTSITGEPLSYKSVEKWCKGESFPETAKMQIIAELLNSTSSYLLGDESKTEVNEQKTSFSRKQIRDYESFSELPVVNKTTVPDSVFKTATYEAATSIFLVEDDAMTPNFKKGDELLLINSEPPAGMPKIAVIGNEEKLFLRRVEKDITGNLTLICDNADKNLFPNITVSTSEFEQMSIHGYVIALTFRSIV